MERDIYPKSGILTEPGIGQTWSFRGSKSRNKVFVAEASGRDYVRVRVLIGPRFPMWPSAAVMVYEKSHNELKAVWLECLMLCALRSEMDEFSLFYRMKP